MRADLREEFDMADEAFALSPISARATLPSEEDYAAIAEAFMETSRGRWFLTEYAKRNRNADTRMVLDAVSRIEQSLTAQKEESRQREESLRREEGLSAQQAAEAVAAAAAAQERLTEALDAIRGAVEAAEESAVEALDSLALDQRLAPVRKGARVLREIAWRLREIGNDGRICDLIDSQVTVIERGTEQFSSEDARVALRAAFAALHGRLVEVEDEDAAPVPLAETDAMAPFSAAQEMPETAETFVAPEAEKAAETPFMSETPFTALARSAEAALAAAEAGLKAAEARQAAETAAAQASSAQDAATQDISLQDTAALHAATQDNSVRDNSVRDNSAQDNAIQNVETEDPDAQDEAVLDIIAMEMGAPDPITDAEIAEAIEEQVRAAEPAPVAPKVVAEAPQPVATPAPPPVQQVVQPPPPPAAAPAPAMEVSLGSTLIASGVLRKPATAANDPLAPIRRMSQAEKIAFFS
jgi:hypothetical protein